MNWRYSVAVIAAFMAMGTSRPRGALALSGKVSRVIDGDTLTLRTDRGPAIRIRLSEIDAPERGQPYSDAARRQLQRLVGGRRIVATVNDTDRYGRSVARVGRGGLDINAEMVKRGAAWAYTRYQTDGRFPMWQRQARRARLGLWAAGGADAVPPWEWRARTRGVSAVGTTAQTVRLTARSLSSPVPELACGKRACLQMASCAEAVFALRRCGEVHLDGDGDGKPCERLWS